MRRRIAAFVLAVFFFAQIAYSAGKAAEPSRDDLGRKTIETFTDTAESAVSGTASIVESSVKDTAGTPKTAIETVKDTAGTAVKKADSAIRALTGDKD